MQDQLPDDEIDQVRSATRAADSAAFAAANRCYTSSPVVARRIREPGVRVPQLLMVPPHPEREYRTQPAEDFILVLGEISDANRQQVVVRAMRYALPGYRLVVAGPPGDPAVLDAIRRDLMEGGLGARVELVPSALTEAQTLDLLARCAAVVALAPDGDGPGVSYEAAMSGKPTIARADGAAASMFVEDGRTGLVVESDPRVLAHAMDELALHPDRARDMGRDARSRAVGLDLSWAQVVTELTR